MEEKRKCLECGVEIMGRADKKFCSDYCRNAYNNRNNKAQVSLIRNINNRLKKNWRILETLNPDYRMPALILIILQAFIPPKNKRYTILFMIKDI